MNRNNELDTVYKAIKNIMIEGCVNDSFKPSDLIERKSKEPGIYDFVSRRTPNMYDFFKIPKPLHEKIDVIPTDSVDNGFKDFGFSFNTELLPLPHERFNYTMNNINGIKKTFFDTQLNNIISNMLYKYAEGKNNKCKFNVDQLNINGWVKNRFSDGQVNPDFIIANLSDILVLTRKKIDAGCILLSEGISKKEIPLSKSVGLPERCALLIDSKFIKANYLNESSLIPCDLKLSFYFRIPFKIDIINSNAVHILELVYGNN